MARIAQGTGQYRLRELLRGRIVPGRLRVTLPASLEKVEGWISWHGRTPHVRLAIDTRGLSLDDVRGFAPKLPAGLDGAGVFTVRTESDGTFELGSERVTVTGRNGGGRV